MNWEEGKLLQTGRYSIIRLIGSGGFGQTYLAEQKQFLYKSATLAKSSQVVIKRPHLNLKSDGNYDKFIRRFEREGRVLLQLDHPNVVKAIELFEDEGMPCLVMEYIPGETLSEYVGNREQIPQDEAVEYFQQLAATLQIVHDAGLIHCDIHPGNIIISRSGRIKKPVLIDFGSAKFLEPQTVTVTTTINRQFTPYEQEEEGGNPQPNWDVYALAATLYFMVTGKKPQSSISCKLSRAKLIPPKQHCPALSDWLNKAILKGMALEAKDRPPSMQSWLKLLLPHPTLLNKASLKGIALGSLARSSLKLSFPLIPLSRTYLKSPFPLRPLRWLIVGYLPTGILLGISGSNTIQSEAEFVAVIIAAIVISFITFCCSLMDNNIPVAIAVSVATFILIKVAGTTAASWAVALAVTLVILLIVIRIDYFLDTGKRIGLMFVGASLSGAISGYFTKMGVWAGLTCGFIALIQFYIVFDSLVNINKALKRRYRPIQVLLITGISSTLGLVLGGGIGWYLRIVGIVKV